MGPVKWSLARNSVKLSYFSVQKKSFINRCADLVQLRADMCTHYLRALLKKVPHEFIFEKDDPNAMDSDGEDDQQHNKKNKKKKKKKKKKTTSDDYPIVDILKSLWIGLLEFAERDERFLVITKTYFQCVLDFVRCCEIFHIWVFVLDPLTLL